MQEKAPAPMSITDGVISFTAVSMTVVSLFGAYLIVKNFLPDGLHAGALHLSPGVLFPVLFFTFCGVATALLIKVLNKIIQGKTKRGLNFDCSASQTI